MSVHNSPCQWLHIALDSKAHSHGCWVCPRRHNVLCCGNGAPSLPFGLASRTSHRSFCPRCPVENDCFILFTQFTSFFVTQFKCCSPREAVCIPQSSVPPLSCHCAFNDKLIKYLIINQLLNICFPQKPIVSITSRTTYVLIVIVSPPYTGEPPVLCSQSVLA